MGLWTGTGLWTGLGLWTARGAWLWLSPWPRPWLKLWLGLWLLQPVVSTMNPTARTAPKRGLTSDAPRLGVGADSRPSNVQRDELSLEDAFILPLLQKPDAVSEFQHIRCATLSLSMQ